MHFHVTGLDTLYAHVPRDILPEECGGHAGKIEDLSDQFYKQLLSKRYVFNFSSQLAKSVLSKYFCLPFQRLSNGSEILGHRKSIVAKTII